MFRLDKVISAGCILAVALLSACGGDSSSSSEEESVYYTDACDEIYKVEGDSWSKDKSNKNYLKLQICDRAVSYINGYNNDVVCVSVDYDSWNERYNITLYDRNEATEQHIWANVWNCNFKLGTESAYYAIITDMGYWQIDGCLCKMVYDAPFYRNAEDDVVVGEQLSSSSTGKDSGSGNSSGSQSRYSSSGDAPNSSSSKTSEIYEFVKLGSQEWMTENLNEPVEGSRCYEDDPENCEKYGRLYTWADAMKVGIDYDRNELGKIKLPHQGICPDGSHIPSYDEWQQLETYLGNHSKDKEFFTNQVGGFYDYRGQYKNERYEALFWSSTEYDVSGTTYDFEYAWLWAFRRDFTIDNDNSHKWTAANVRCVRAATLDESSSSSAEMTESSNSLYDPDVESVRIGTQVWSTRNLDTPVEGSMCYDDDPENCEKYGRLYTWALAMDVETKFDAEQLGDVVHPYRGICPSGWHLPSDKEWRDLYEYLQDYPDYQAYFMNQPGGVFDYNGYYRSIGNESLYWSSTEYDVSGTDYEYEFAYVWSYRADGSVGTDNAHKITGAYVRCVEDEIVDVN